MLLDSSTLILTVVLVTVSAVTANVIGWLQRRDQTVLLWMAAGFLAEALSLCLFLARPLLPIWVTIDLGNAGMLLSSGLLWMGYRSLEGRGGAALVLVAPVVWLLGCQIPAIYGSFDNRVIVASGLHTLLLGTAGLELWRGRREKLFWRPWLIAIMWGGAAWMGSRVVSVIVWPHPGMFHWEPKAGFAATMLIAIGFFSLNAVGIMMLLRERSENQYRRASRLDPLTGLANRRQFDESLRRYAAQSRQRRRPLSLLMIDTDHFKAYNDHLGHPAGDRCLIRLAETMQANLRRDMDLIARLGGEEFAVLLPDTERAEAIQVAARLQAALRQERIAHPSNPCGLVTMSIGVSTLPSGSPAASLHDLVEAADRALYGSKTGGRDAVTWGEVTMAKKAASDQVAWAS